MPISPENAERDNLAGIKQSLAKIEKQIDKELRARYFGDNPVIVYIDGTLNQRVLSEIIKNYESVGWHVTHKTSFRMNETTNTFTFRKKIVPTRRLHNPNETWDAPKTQLEMERGADRG